MFRCVDCGREWYDTGRFMCECRSTNFAAVPMDTQATTQHERDLVAREMCPRCRGSLDTGFECIDCGYDAMPIATEPKS